MPPQGVFRDAHSLTEALLDSDPRILTRPFRTAPAGFASTRVVARLRLGLGLVVGVRFYHFGAFRPSVPVASTKNIGNDTHTV